MWRFLGDLLGSYVDWATDPDQNVFMAMVRILGPLLLVMVVIWVGISWASDYYEDRYPCLEYKAVWVPEYESTTYIKVGDVMVPSTTTYPAHWEQQCQKRGKKKYGDLRAPYAKIPE
jgi:hypothetical protein